MAGWSRNAQAHGANSNLWFEFADRFSPTCPFSVHPQTHLSGLLCVERSASADQAQARLRPSPVVRGMPEQSSTSS